MDHLYDHHESILKDLCRICGSRAQTKKEKIYKKKTGHTVVKHKTLIQNYYGIDTSDMTLPDKLCTLCHQVMYKFSKGRKYEMENQKQYRENAKTIDFIWKNPGSWDFCNVCSLYEAQKHTKTRLTMLEYLNSQKDPALTPASPLTHTSELSFDENASTHSPPQTSSNDPDTLDTDHGLTPSPPEASLSDNPTLDAQGDHGLTPSPQETSYSDLSMLDTQSDSDLSTLDTQNDHGLTPAPPETCSSDLSTLDTQCDNGLTPAPPETSLSDISTLDTQNDHGLTPSSPETSSSDCFKLTPSKSSSRDFSIDSLLASPIPQATDAYDPSPTLNVTMAKGSPAGAYGRNNPQVSGNVVQGSPAGFYAPYSPFVNIPVVQGSPAGVHGPSVTAPVAQSNLTKTPLMLSRSQCTFPSKYSVPAAVSSLVRPIPMVPQSTIDNVFPFWNYPCISAFDNSSPQVDNVFPFQNYPCMSAFSPVISDGGDSTIKQCKKARKIKPQDKGPLSASEKEDMYEYIIRYRYYENADSLKVKNGKRTITYHYIPEPQVTSENASGRTQRRRAKLQENIRKATKSKLSAEIARIPLSEREKETGISMPHLTDQDTLILKVYSNLPWNGLNKVLEVLKMKGITSTGENSQRKEKRTIIGDHLQTTLQEFKFKDPENPCADKHGCVVKSEPWCRAKDLPDYIKNVLDRYERTNQLIWREGMPNNEIWIKLSGDKGGGSTKCGFQIINIEKPNSPNNYFLFSVFEAPDYRENLETALSGFASPLDEMTEWNGKKLVKIGAGDIAYESNMLGPTGKSYIYYITVYRIIPNRSTGA